MYELTIEARFSAAHAITIRDEREPLHGHDWHVTVTIEGAALDPDGLVCDFHAAESALREIVAPFHNRNLNQCHPFDRVNPTAELVARHVGETLARALRAAMPEAHRERGVRVSKLKLTEAPGCAATWIA